MSTLDTNPKWYVYIDAIKNHEGPLAAKEVGDRLNERKITPSSFVWTEGMPDWKPLSEVTELEPILRSFQPLPPKDFANALNRVPVVSQEAAPAESETSSAETSRMIVAQDRAVSEEPIVKEKTSSFTLVGKVEPTSMSAKRKTSFKRILFLIISGGIIGYGVIGYMSGQFDPVLEHPLMKQFTASVSSAMSGPVYDFVAKTPSLQWATSFISPIEKIADVATEDFELLVAGAAKPLSEGLKAAVAASTTVENLSTPTIYVSSNAPAGTKFQVAITGRPETLLGHLDFTKTEVVTIEKRLGKSIPIRSIDGKPIPTGEYRIDVSLVAGQTNPEFGKVDTSKYLTRTFVFLGGLKNEIYTQKLNEFHKKVIEQATKELADAKQFQASIENQMKTSVQETDKLRKQKNFKAAKVSWTKFNDGWVKFNTSLKEQFSKWTPDSFKNDFFYGPLFEKIGPALEAVVKVQENAATYFSGVKAPAAAGFDSARSPLVSQANERLAAIRSMLDQIEKEPKSADGLPRKLK